MSRTVGDRHLSREALSSLPISPLIESCETLFTSEPGLLELAGPFVVVGDLHGDIDTLLQVLGAFDYPPSRSYLFLGDYVDRGENSIEVLLILYALKVLFPNHLYLLRGNHELKSICHKYGFREECCAFFSTKKPYTRFCRSFCEMPIAAVLNERVFCVHGGLSPAIEFLSDIPMLIEKPLTDVAGSPAGHLLWSDPSKDCTGFTPSAIRRTGFLFGADAVAAFLNDNGLSLMIRAHEFCDRGSHWTFDTCLTVFSTCNYCGKGNTGAVALVSGPDSVEVREIRKCARSDLPYALRLPLWFFEAPPGQEPFGDALETPLWLDI
jgi:protein phosphatase